MKDSVRIFDTDLENCKLIKYNLMNADTETYYTIPYQKLCKSYKQSKYAAAIFADTRPTNKSEGD